MPVARFIKIVFHEPLFQKNVCCLRNKLRTPQTYLYYPCYYSDPPELLALCSSAVAELRGAAAQRRDSQMGKLK